jgi:hypothetical protein
MLKGLLNPPHQQMVSPTTLAPLLARTHIRVTSTCGPSAEKIVANHGGVE